MKKLLPLLILFSLITAISIKFNFISLETRKRTKGKLKYVALGDSIATGTGAKYGYTKRYSDYLEDKYSKPIEYVNLGKNGWTSKQLLDALKNRASFRNHFKNADVVTINIGGNDILYCLARAKMRLGGGEDNEQCYRDTLKSFKKNLEEIFNEIRSLTPLKTKILTVTNYSAFKNWDNDILIMRKYSLEANEFIRKLSSEMGIALGDVANKFNGENLSHPANGLLFVDKIHPNEKGHKAIAEVLRRADNEDSSK